MSEKEMLKLEREKFLKLIKNNQKAESQLDFAPELETFNRNKYNND